MDDTAASDHTSPLDRIAGGLMFVAFVVMHLVWLWSARNLSVLHPAQEERLRMAPVAWGTLSALLGLAVNLWYSVGVFKGLRCALVIAALNSAGKAAGYAEYAQGLSLEWKYMASGGFYVLVFVYCGLRLFGSLGPRFPGLLPVRYSARFED